MSLHEKYTREEFEEKENQIKRNKRGSLDMYDLLKPVTKPGNKFEYPEINNDTAEALFYGIDYLEKRISKELDTRGMIESLSNKVYEKLIEGKTPEVAIFSLNDYGILNSIREFKTDYIEIRGAKLKVHVSTNAKDGKIEIY